MMTVSETVEKLDQAMREGKYTLENRVQVLAHYLAHVLTDDQAVALAAHLKAEAATQSQNEIFILTHRSQNRPRRQPLSY